MERLLCFPSIGAITPYRVTCVFLRYSRLPYRARTQQHRYYGDNVIDPYRALSFYRAALTIRNVIF